MNILKKTARKDPLVLLFEETITSPQEISHEASKLNHANIRGFRRRMQRVLGQEFFLKRIAQAYKTYPTIQSIALPKPLAASQPPLAQALFEIIAGRRSCRAYDGSAVTQDQLSTVLQNSYGITGRAMLPFKIEQRLRAAPSGGGLYPLEVYAACFDVEGITPGIYHYRTIDHHIEPIKLGQFRDEFGRAFFYEEMFQKLPLLVIITGVLKRSSIKYNERAYRFMLLEAGHVGQNLCLSATALKLGSVMLGGFMDDDVSTLLGVDGLQEAALYSAAIGGTQ
ncbi:MAG TPA: SagB/ThcOx family dehydrogenase [Pyrinomonadaceae bacterium]|jgi:SagB-type dehydrogenase family enzyme|nr:SagB/ThcOx family dehydrogenase [Pyrinomonadaceae bacterium]